MGRGRARDATLLPLTRAGRGRQSGLFYGAYSTRQECRVWVTAQCTQQRRSHFNVCANFCRPPRPRGERVAMAGVRRGGGRRRGELTQLQISHSARLGLHSTAAGNYWPQPIVCTVQCAQKLIAHSRVPATLLHGAVVSGCKWRHPSAGHFVAHFALGYSKFVARMSFAGSKGVLSFSPRPCTAASRQHACPLIGMINDGLLVRAAEWRQRRPVPT